MSQQPDSVTDKPLISIVMPTFNRAEWVGGAIESLLCQQTEGEFDYELIVVDNASKDDTREVVTAAIAGSPVAAQYVHSEKPGDAPTRNAGVRLAKGQWLAFFDDDQFADPRWLLELLRAASECGGRVVGGPVRLDLTDAQLRALGRLGRAALREIDFYPALQPYQGKDLPGLGNALVDRRLFDEVGLFDESMTGGGSDFNFFRQARQQGNELWYSPHAVIRHRIEANRLTHAFQRWEAVSSGAHQALDDSADHGKLMVVASGMARLGRSVLVTAPLRVLAGVRGDVGETLSRKIQWWRTAGYVRGALRALAPSLLTQQPFFDSLDFRLGREIGKETAAEEVTA